MQEGVEVQAYQWDTTPANHKVPGSIVNRVNLFASMRVSAQGSHCQAPTPLLGGLSSSTPWEKNSPSG